MYGDANGGCCKIRVEKLMRISEKNFFQTKLVEFLSFIYLLCALDSETIVLRREWEFNKSVGRSKFLQKEWVLQKEFVFR